MALLEETHVDGETGRIVNANIAEYLVPVNADVPDIQTIIVPNDELMSNPLGAKGIGELPMVGVAAAVANAVYHATGVRVRKVPITDRGSSRVAEPGILSHGNIAPWFTLAGSLSCVPFRLLASPQVSSAWLSFRHALTSTTPIAASLSRPLPAVWRKYSRHSWRSSGPTRRR